MVPSKIGFIFAAEWEAHLPCIEMWFLSVSVSPARCVTMWAALILPKTSPSLTVVLAASLRPVSPEFSGKNAVEESQHRYCAPPLDYAETSFVFTSFLCRWCFYAAPLLYLLCKEEEEEMITVKLFLGERPFVMRICSRLVYKNSEAVSVIMSSMSDQWWLLLLR